MLFCLFSRSRLPLSTLKKVDDDDKDKVIQLGKHRSEFAMNYQAGEISLKTHPIMRQFNDPEWDPSIYVEMAKVAAVSCIHQCITKCCGGNPNSGEGCRFDFPKPKLNHTVPAVMQVNANQMEARVLLRRTVSGFPILTDISSDMYARIMMFQFLLMLPTRRGMHRSMSEDMSVGTKRKFKSRDVASGHWILSKRRVRRHTRPSTVLYTAPAIVCDVLRFAHGETKTAVPIIL